MSNWDRPIMTDSGGFQAYSLIRQNPKFGSLTPKGILFRPENSDRKLNLTPEKSIQLQFGYGSDILPVVLKEAGIIRAEKSGVKVLGNGELTKKLTVKAAKFSKSAEAAITAKGGSIEVI